MQLSQDTPHSRIATFAVLQVITYSREGWRRMTGARGVTGRRYPRQVPPLVARPAAVAARADRDRVVRASVPAWPWRTDNPDDEELPSLPSAYARQPWSPAEDADGSDGEGSW